MSFGDIETLKEPLRSRVKAVLGMGAGVVGRIEVSPVSGLPIRHMRIVDPLSVHDFPTPSAGRTRARRGIPGPKKQTATERAYNVECLGGLGVFEALSFYFKNGHRYRPDFVVLVDGRPSECHECKGGYALHSQQRARLAWDQARVEYPGLTWVWAVRRRGNWEVERYDPVA